MSAALGHGRSGRAWALDSVLVLCNAGALWPLTQRLAWNYAAAGRLGECFEDECLYRAAYLIAPTVWVGMMGALLLGLQCWPRFARYLGWTLTDMAAYYVLVPHLFDFRASLGLLWGLLLFPGGAMAVFLARRWRAAGGA